MMMAQILEESLYDFLTQMSSAHVSSLYQLFFKEISAYVFLNFFWQLRDIRRSCFCTHYPISDGIFIDTNSDMEHKLSTILPEDYYTKVSTSQPPSPVPYTPPSFLFIVL